MSDGRPTTEAVDACERLRYRPGPLVDDLLLLVLHLDLAVDRRVRRHLPQPRSERMGQDAVDDLRDLHAVPGRLRVSHRARSQDAGARNGGCTSAGCGEPGVYPE